MENRIVTEQNLRGEVVVNPKAVWLQDYCRQRGWEEACIMGRPGIMLPTNREVVTRDGYRSVPFKINRSKLPAFVQARVEALVVAGIDTDQMFIVHEPQKEQLSEAQPKTMRQKPVISAQNRDSVKKALIAMGTVALMAAVFAVVFAAAVAVAALILSGTVPFILVGLVIMGGLALSSPDPILCVQLKDGTLIEIAAWFED